MRSYRRSPAEAKTLDGGGQAHYLDDCDEDVGDQEESVC